MAITLERLCANAEKTYGMKLLAGSRGIGNFVRWVHMVEDREVPSFLHGNELVFTTGIGQQQKDVLWLLDFVIKLQQSRACGLVINLGPYVKAIPPKVLDYAEVNNFPLFVVPWSVHLIDITYDFCHRIVANEENEVTLGTAFKNLIFAPYEERGYKPILERQGFHSDASFRVIAMTRRDSANPAGLEEQLRISYRIQRIMNHYSLHFSLFRQDGYWIVVIQNSSDTNFSTIIQTLSGFKLGADPTSTLRIGVSEVGTGFKIVPELYQHAVAALQVAKLQAKELIDYNQLGIFKLILAIERHDLLRAFVQENIGPLQDYDQENDTDFVETLRIYIESDTKVLEAAKQKAVHRNTINYKIKRIREILRISLNQEDKLRFLLAFHIQDLIGQ